MPDVSILEFAVTAFVAYSALLMLIISIIKELPMSRSMSISRSIYILLGVICMFQLTGMGLDFHGETTINISNRTTFNETSDLIFTEITNSTTTAKITLLNYPTWHYMHWMFAGVMVFFFILQMVALLTKTD